LTPPLHNGTVRATSAAQAAKNHDVVFSGEVGAFIMNCVSLGKNKMSYVPPDWPTSVARLGDNFGV
jgi:hypothetical protein